MVAAVTAAATLGGATLTAGPVSAAEDYSRFQIGPGVYPCHPLALARIEAEGGGCGQLLYFDCDGLYGPPAPCDDPEFWLEWS